MKTYALLFLILCLLSAPNPLKAQVNSGSNGSDGAFHPTQNVTIDMNLRPDGIYHYTSVNIPAGVTVSFIPNSNNTPIVWLVQGNCVVRGIVQISGESISGAEGIPGQGGPGGFMGGPGGFSSRSGEGPGGGSRGSVSLNGHRLAGSASHATLGDDGSLTLGGRAQPGSMYGNKYLIPLIGGSGGGGSGDWTSVTSYGGGGGGGAILIASNETITMSGQLLARGGNSIAANLFSSNLFGGGGGSGGSIRFVAPSIAGTGFISTIGGPAGRNSFRGGSGWVRFDCLHRTFSGAIEGNFTEGFQPIIFPAAGQGTQLAIQSIGGLAVAANPNGVLTNPDVAIPAQQQNPMNVVIGCSNLPLNTLITVVVRPASGPEIVATGRNTNGSQASSTATIPVEMPRGGGIIFARCVSGVNGVSSTGKDSDVKNIAQTGWTADGETFSQIEITAGLNGSQQVAYLTASGKRYALPQE